MFSTGFRELNSLLRGGYAEKSTVLITGSVGLGKEELLYSFINSGIIEGDICLYITRQTAIDVMADMKARGIVIDESSLAWFVGSGSDRKYTPDDLAKLSFNVKEFLRENHSKRIRIVLDSLSSLLMINSSDSVYRFLSQLFAEVKRYDASILAVVEEDMHSPAVIASMQQIFDGVLKVGYEDKSVFVEVRKMTGVDVPSGSKIVIPSRAESSSDSETGLGEKTERKRIAVLPLASFSPDPNDEFFADGLTEELIDRLCQIRDLEVIARTSVMAYKNKDKKAGEIGKELKVGSLVEGSVRKAGNRIRVTAQLIDVKTEAHLWSSRYDSELQDIFAVQTDIAEKITEALKVSLIDAEKKRIGRKATSVPEAYVAYLNAVHFRYKIGLGREALRKAIEYLNKAIELDPNYAQAFAQLAINYTFLAVSWAEPPPQAYSKAKEFAMKAIQLDPKNAEAYYAKSWVSFFLDMDFRAAEREAKTAIELNPSYAEPRTSLAFVLLALGQKEDALSEARKAVDLDPLGIYSHYALARILSIFGKFEESIIEHKKAIEIEPNSTFLYREMGYTYLYMGEAAEGTKAMEMAVSLPDGNFSISGLGYAHAISGKKEEALKIARELEMAMEKGMTIAYYIALIYAGLGETSKALALLEHAFEERSIVYLVLINVEPAFVNLHSEPRFKALLKKMNLAF